MNSNYKVARKQKRAPLSIWRGVGGEVKSAINEKSAINFA